MAGDKFERIEKKFWMNPDQCREMMPVLRTFMKEDIYGYSEIRNIYCDSDDYYLIRRSNEKPQFKEKLRIRSYSDFAPDAEVFVEIKRKVRGIGYKRRICIPYAMVEPLLRGEHISCDNPQIEQELHEFIRRYHPRKKICLNYSRIAMVGKEDPSLRITIDRNIRYRIYETERDLYEETFPVLEDSSLALMEVKAHGSLPGWLVANLSGLKIYSSSFSKVGNCYTKYIAPTHYYGVGNMEYEQQKQLIYQERNALC